MDTHTPRQDQHAFICQASRRKRDALQHSIAGQLTREAERNGDEEPQGNQAEEGSKRDGARGASVVNEDIEDSEQQQGDAREEGSHPPGHPIPSVIAAVDDTPEPD